MGSNNPRFLQVRLEELSEKLRYWSYATGDLLEVALLQQKLTDGAVQEEHREANIALYQFQEDEEQFQKTQSIVASLLERCREAQATALKTLQQASDALQAAQNTLDHWQYELELAKAWLARARARLEAAIREERLAEQNLLNAQSSLRSAQNALYACERDDTRRNCYSEAAAVNRAQAAVRAAQIRLEAARAERLAAEEEVRQAEARVACCTRAVGFAKNAVAIAEKAHQNANDGVSHAERSLEYSQAAQRSLDEARVTLEQESETIESLMHQVRAAGTSCDEALQHLRGAEHHEGVAQNDVLGALDALDQRIRLLVEANRPNLGEGIKRVAAWGAAAAITVASAFPSSEAIEAFYHHSTPETIPTVVGNLSQAEVKAITGIGEMAQTFGEALKKRDEMENTISEALEPPLMVQPSPPPPGVKDFWSHPLTAKNNEEAIERIVRENAETADELEKKHREGGK